MNKTQATYSSSYTRRAIHLLRQRWPNIDKEFVERGIDTDAMMTEMFCSGEQLGAVMQLLYDKMGDSAGYLFARGVRLSFVGPAAATMLSSPDIRTALSWCVQVGNLSSGTEIKLFVLGKGAEMTFNFPDDMSAGFGEIAIVTTAKLISEILSQGVGGVPIRKCILTLPTDCVSAPDLIAGALNNITINWDASKPISLFVPRDFLKQPLVNSDPITFQQSIAYAAGFFEAANAASPDRNNLTIATIDTIRQMDPLDVSLTSASKSMGLSETVLKDRLRESGTTFTEIRNAAWIEIALKLAEQSASRVEAANHFGKTSANFGEWFKAHHPAGKSYSEIKV